MAGPTVKNQKGRKKVVCYASGVFGGCGAVHWAKTFEDSAFYELFSNFIVILNIFI
jgi:hypothetical protein